MLGTVVPLSQGDGSDFGRRSLVFYSIGSLLGGGAMGFTLALLGLSLREASDMHPTPTFIGLVVGLVALLYAIQDLELLRVPRPQVRRQVPNSWRYRFSRRKAGLYYGFGLGFGVFTFISAASLYVVLAWGLLYPDVIAVSLTISAFGLGRAIPLIAITVPQSPGSAIRLAEAIYDFRPVVKIGEGLLLAAVGSFAVYPQVM